jgi:hypothetical protein
MVIMDENKVMGNKKRLQNSKNLEVLDYYHNNMTEHRHVLSRGIKATWEFVQGREATRHGRPAMRFGRAAT